jgi:hypothetical protein
VPDVDVVAERLAELQQHAPHTPPPPK